MNLWNENQQLQDMGVQNLGKGMENGNILGLKMTKQPSQMQR
jgi:hypothetical protein